MPSLVAKRAPQPALGLLFCPDPSVRRLLRFGHDRCETSTVMGARFDTLVEMFEQTVVEHDARPVFGTKRNGAWTWTTYAELHGLIKRFRAGLAGIGVDPGDRVAIVAANRVEWAVAAYATYGLGAIFVPLYEEQSKAEWELILRDSGAKVAVAANEDIAAQLRTLQPSLPLLSRIIPLDSSSEGSFRTLLQAGEASPVPLRPVTASTCATMIYTSGTTGRPKGVMLTHGNIASNIQAVHELFEFSERDRSLAFIPWAHAFGHTCELHTMLSLGASIGINDEIANLATNLLQVKPTILVAVPRVFNRIFAGVEARMAGRSALVQKLYAAGREAAKKKTRHEATAIDRIVSTLADALIFSKIRARFGGRLKYAISGGASLAPEVAELLEGIGLQVYEGYGLTETSPMVAVNHPGQARIGTVGPILTDVNVRIGQVPDLDGESGEIEVCGPNVMAGYYHRPDEQKDAFTRDGWFRTGDLGYVDGDGFLHITGRIKEQYKLENGKYVAPAVLEEQLKLSRYVANALIYGADKPYNVALIVVDLAAVRAWADAQGITLDDPVNDAGVRDLLRGEVASHSAAFRSFERPKDFVITTQDFTVANGMLTPTLKIKRRSVLAEYGPALEALYAANSRRESDFVRIEANTVLPPAQGDPLGSARRA